MSIKDITAKLPDNHASSSFVTHARKSSKKNANYSKVSSSPVPKVFLTKKEIGQNDIVLGKARKERSLYDKVLEDWWETYEGKGHDEKDQCAKEIAECLMQSGVRFMEVHGDQPKDCNFHVLKTVTHKIKNKVKRDVKNVVNMKYDLLELTEKQIEERLTGHREEREARKAAEKRASRSYRSVHMLPNATLALVEEVSDHQGGKTWDAAREKPSTSATLQFDTLTCQVPEFSAPPQQPDFYSTASSNGFQVGSHHQGQYAFVPMPAKTPQEFEEPPFESSGSTQALLSLMPPMDDHLIEERVMSPVSLGYNPPIPSALEFGTSDVQPEDTVKKMVSPDTVQYSTIPTREIEDFQESNVFGMEDVFGPKPWPEEGTVVPCNGDIRRASQPTKMFNPKPYGGTSDFDLAFTSEDEGGDFNGAGFISTTQSTTTTTTNTHRWGYAGVPQFVKDVKEANNDGTTLVDFTPHLFDARQKRIGKGIEADIMIEYDGVAGSKRNRPEDKPSHMPVHLDWGSKRLCRAVPSLPIKSENSF